MHYKFFSRFGMFFNGPSPIIICFCIKTFRYFQCFTYDLIGIPAVTVWFNAHAAVSVYSN